MTSPSTTHHDRSGRDQALPRSISLIAMPGAGKSTSGRHLAHVLGVPFVDADHEIERRIGCSVRAFFEREGEAAFRDVEQQVIADLMAASPRVVATGGGAVLRPANREQLRQNSVVIYLRATPEELFRRLRHDTQRPLLQVGDPLRRLRDLYRDRDPLYRETAQFIIDTGRPSVTAMVNMMLMQLELAGLVDPLRVPARVGAAELPPAESRPA